MGLHISFCSMFEFLDEGRLRAVWGRFSRLLSWLGGREYLEPREPALALWGRFRERLLLLLARDAVWERSNFGGTTFPCVAAIFFPILATSSSGLRAASSAVESAFFTSGMSSINFWAKLLVFSSTSFGLIPPPDCNCISLNMASLRVSRCRSRTKRSRRLSWTLAL